MKKAIATCLFIIQFCPTVFGQKCQIGLNQGFGFAQLSSYREAKNDGFGAGRVLSWVSGIDLQGSPNQQWAFSLAYNFTKKGTTRYYISKKYSYQEALGSVRFNIQKDAAKVWQPFLRAGGYFAVLKSQSEETIPTTGLAADIFLFEFSDVRNLDFGFVAGLGSDFKISPNISVFLEVRLAHGAFPLINSFRKVYNISGWTMTGARYSF